jgi:SAM-dependent methyltransferase
VSAYEELQDAVADATAGVHAERVLELGVGTGETSRRVLHLYPAAELVGVDKSADMLAAASIDVAAADLRVSRLQDLLPEANSTLSCRRLRCTTSTVQLSRTSSPAPPPAPAGRTVRARPPRGTR